MKYEQFVNAGKVCDLLPGVPVWGCILWIIRKGFSRRSILRLKNCINDDISYRFLFWQPIEWWGHGAQWFHHRRKLFWPGLSCRIQCNIAHLCNEKDKLDDIFADMEQLLRNTLGYNAVKSEPNGKEKPLKFLEAAKGVYRNREYAPKDSIPQYYAAKPLSSQE